jgi:hypothetical protein
MRKKKRIALPPPRRRVVSDLQVQGALLYRLALHVFSCLLYFSLIIVITESMADPLRSKWEITTTFLDEAIYWAPGLLVLLPMFAYDLLSVSNRFTGPVVRLRHEMRRLTRGEQIAPVRFRDNDFWDEMAREFNELRDELLQLRKQSAGASDASDAAKKSKLFEDGEQADMSGELLETASA